MRIHAGLSADIESMSDASVVRETSEKMGRSAGKLYSAEDHDWASLVLKIAEGCPDAFEELYVALEGFRRYLGRRLGMDDGDDVFHDLIVDLVTRIRRGEMRDPGRILGYVRTMAARGVADWWRAGARARTSLNAIRSHVSDTLPDPETAAIRRLDANRATRLLMSLKPLSREVLVRFYIKGDSAETIQASLGFTKTQFRLIKSRAKARFAYLCQEDRKQNRDFDSRVERDQPPARAKTLSGAVAEFPREQSGYGQTARHGQPHARRDLA